MKCDCNNIYFFKDLYFFNIKIFSKFLFIFTIIFLVLIFLKRLFFKKIGSMDKTNEDREFINLNSNLSSIKNSIDKILFVFGTMIGAFYYCFYTELNFNLLKLVIVPIFLGIIISSIRLIRKTYIKNEKEIIEYRSKSKLYFFLATFYGLIPGIFFSKEIYFGNDFTGYFIFVILGIYLYIFFNLKDR